MSEEWQTLKVHMLGNFTLTYGKKPVSFGRNRNTKSIHLLQILLYYGDKGISREALIEKLYGRGEFSDAVHNLYVCVHRLKAILAATILPQYDYIVLKKGVYWWKAPMEMENDAKIFLNLTEKIRIDTPEDARKLDLAVGMYHGAFLPGISDEDWVMVENMRYKMRYEQAVKMLGAYYIENGEYKSAMRIITGAAKIFPYDDWQALQMECLIAQNRYEEAIEVYLQTSKLLQDEMGIRPSERMQQLFQSIWEKQKKLNENSMAEVLECLNEDGNCDSAYCCSLPGFRDAYRMVARRLEHKGKEASLMMCSLEPCEDAEKKMETLAEVINRNLRRTDVFTKCSTSQYLILLCGVGEDRCGVVMDRIRRNFSESEETAGKYLKFLVAPVEATQPLNVSKYRRRADDF